MLRVTNVGQEYYKRQLAVHNFGIHDTKTKKATMFVCSENFAHKGPNEIISMLDFYVKKLSENVKNIVIFYNNCSSQNKNKYLIALLYYLSNIRFQEVNVFLSYPRS